MKRVVMPRLPLALSFLCVSLLLTAAELPAASLSAGNEALTVEVEGGRIATIRLKSEKFKDDLLAVEKAHPQEPNALSLLFRVVSGSTEAMFDEARADWRVEETPRRDVAREFTFSARVGDPPGATTETGLSLSVKKSLVVRKEEKDAHRLGFAVKFRNESERPVAIESPDPAIPGGFALGLFPAIGEKGDDDFAVANAGGAFRSHALGHGGSKVEWGGEIRYAGVMDHFFLAALEFRAARPAKVEAAAFDERTTAPARILARFDRLALEPGESRTLEFDLVVAKKSYDLLAAYGLEEVCEFTGFSGPFAILLIRGLAFFHGIAKDWGLAIILLTVAVRIALHPLNAKQARSMKAMQKIQPLLKELQVKYADDQQRLSQEMMKLYREHNVSPFGGCLPLLVQIPILIGLFTALRGSIEMRGERFLWLPDLAGADPYYLLPVLIAVTMQIQQGQMNVDPQQAAAFRFMPIMMFFLCMSLPAGVLVYWLVSNILQILQQAYEPAPAPAPVPVKPPKKG